MLVSTDRYGSGSFRLGERFSIEKSKNREFSRAGRRIVCSACSPFEIQCLDLAWTRLIVEIISMIEANFEAEFSNYDLEEETRYDRTTNNVVHGDVCTYEFITFPLKRPILGSSGYLGPIDLGHHGQAINDRFKSIEIWPRRFPPIQFSVATNKL